MESWEESFSNKRDFIEDVVSRGEVYKRSSVMIYSDGIHIVADSLEELHEWCSKNKIKRCWFHGVRKGHPHYDWPSRFFFGKQEEIKGEYKIIPRRELLKLSKQLA